MRVDNNLKMPKLKRFLADPGSPFDLSDTSTTPKNINSRSVNKSDSKISSKCAKTTNRRNNIPDDETKIKITQTKSISNAPGPSSAKDCHPALLLDNVNSKPGTVTTKISSSKHIVRKTAEEKNINCTSSSSEDFESDLLEADFFSQTGHKLPYTKKEDEFILEYVLKGQNIFRVGSLSLWKYLEQKKDIPKRTYQSLKNRFLRNIKPHLFTKYRHCIENKETVSKILAKFPELKKQMGFKDTLSKIDLPTRKGPKSEAQSDRYVDKYEENIERTTLGHSLKSDDIFDPIVQPSLKLSQSDPPNNVSSYRKVYFRKEAIFVSVNLTHPNHSDAAVSSLMKISERFKNLRKKRERNFCLACGRHYSNRRESYLPESDEESDVMIFNSVDESKGSPKNLRKRKFNTNLSNNQKTKHKILSPESSPRNQGSQSLLKYDDEICDLNKTAQNAEKDSREGSDYLMPFTSKDEVPNVENATIKVQVQEKSETVISEKEAGLGTQKQWESESEIDIIYESTMAGFQKLIDADEEKMLFRKFLYKNCDLIGFNSDSEKNVDSYFLESSPEVKTPTLTENYLNSSQNDTVQTKFESASSSHLASNMIRMLTKEKSENKKAQL